MSSEKRVFKTVPLDNNWALPGTKLDLKAMYGRPRRSIGEYDEVVQERGPDGRPLYDIVGPLPLRRHADWTAKGFVYITVAVIPFVEGSPWPVVASSLRAKGLNPADYLQHPQFGTWNPKLYLATADQVETAKFSALRALVERLGSEAVLAVRQSEDPTFALPPALQGIPPGGTVTASPKPKPTPAPKAKPVAAKPSAAPGPEVQG